MRSERRPGPAGESGDAAPDDRRGSPGREAWAAALRALARRPRSAFEIEKLLREKFGDEAVVESTLARLAEARLLDDGAVAGAVLRDAARRGLGSRRVRLALRRRGVAPDAVPGADETDAHDLAAARALLLRRFPGGVPADPRGRARALRTLAARGFPSALARRLLGIDSSLDDEAPEPGDD